MTLHRRDILGRAGRPAPALPWTDPARVIERCTACGACATACPQDILRIEAGRHPVIDWRAPCIFCAACAEACPEGVFDLARDPPWPLAAVVSTTCLEREGITCRACEDRCDARALRARPLPGGAALMTVDVDACTGCGACVSACPVGAITITAPGEEDRDAA